MSVTDAPASWTDPRYVATVVTLLAVGALYAYTFLSASGPTAREVTFVLLVVSVPATVAYEAARRFG